MRNDVRAARPLPLEQIRETYVGVRQDVQPRISGAEFDRTIELVKMEAQARILMELAESIETWAGPKAYLTPEARRYIRMYAAEVEAGERVV